jgi:hypothetical protein
MAESKADESSSVDDIRTKEAETAVNLKSQEEEDEKYKSESTEVTTFKDYLVRDSESHGRELRLIFVMNSASLLMVPNGI